MKKIIINLFFIVSLLTVNIVAHEHNKNCNHVNKEGLYVGSALILCSLALMYYNSLQEKEPINNVEQKEPEIATPVSPSCKPECTDEACTPGRLDFTKRRTMRSYRVQFTQ